ncbi:MAG: hypothetical protein D4R88_06775 [Methanosarcinales archaeon]|nr:MAG: hypothetical protein D4R88_06775 [Methanosarcinales archaeon]
MDQRIVAESLEELRFILNWVRERGESAENPVTVLVGGWAVYAYNPWIGSIDIDLVTNGDTKDRLMRFLIRERGYDHYRIPGIHTVYKSTDHGPIFIDFGNRNEHNKFEGRDEELNFDMLNGQTTIKEIRSGLPVTVPTRSLLLLFKLKASWDRAYRIEEETSDDMFREQGKLIKDYADIIALIDPAHGGRDIDTGFLGEKLGDFYFLKECLRRIPENRDAVGMYNGLSQEAVRDNIMRLLSLV